jgi:hypothetical protein
VTADLKARGATPTNVLVSSEGRRKRRARTPSEWQRRDPASGLPGPSVRIKDTDLSDSSEVNEAFYNSFLNIVENESGIDRDDIDWLLQFFSHSPPSELATYLASTDPKIKAVADKVNFLVEACNDLPPKVLDRIHTEAEADFELLSQIAANTRVKVKLVATSADLSASDLFEIAEFCKGLDVLTSSNFLAERSKPLFDGARKILEFAPSLTDLLASDLALIDEFCKVLEYTHNPCSHSRTALIDGGLKALELATKSTNPSAASLGIIEAVRKVFEVMSAAKPGEADAVRRRKVPKPCLICGFMTEPPHDARNHKSQGRDKRPFTEEELGAKNLVKEAQQV